MRTPPLARSAALLILALSLHGCGSDSSTNPNNGSMNQSTADDFALQTVTSLSVVGADLQVAVGSTPSSAARSMRAPGDLARPSRALWDTSFVQAGVTFEASRRSSKSTILHTIGSGREPLVANAVLQVELAIGLADIQ